MTIKIKHRYTDVVLYTSEAATTLKAAVVEAVSKGANLGGAYLGDANLRDANLGGANLRGAYLRGANLGGANLGDANLRDANLGGANLGGAYLGDANLRDANLGGANLLSIGNRSDGYTFYAQIKAGEIWIIAGCRYFSIKDAAKHWKTTCGGTQLGDESLQLLKNARALVKIRGLLK